MDAGAPWVIPWADVTVDGARAPPLAALVPGASFAWSGEPVAIVSPGAPLRLERAVPAGPGRIARRVFAPPDRHAPRQAAEADASVPHHLILTDGTTGHLCRLVAGTRGWLCVFDRPPPRAAEVWVAGLHLPAPAGPDPVCPAGLLAGTPVLTQAGPRDVAGLKPGDRIVTRDSGVVPLASVMVAAFGGGRLYAEPGLRPVRLAGDEADLHVAPGQPVLIGGAGCDDLFLTLEVLVRAADLVDEHRIAADLRTRRAVYVTPVLPVSALILAAGRWVAAGAPSLRLLTRAEAAILGHRTGNRAG